MSDDTNQKPPKGSLPLPGPREVFAFECSLGIPESEACRRAGGDPRHGTATKWARSRKVQERIAYLRKLGHTDEMIAAKRARIEERLSLAAYGNIFDFRVEPYGPQTTDLPQINWAELAKSPLGVIISGFRFDKDTGRLVNFDRDDALQALAQLRDMHGFAAPRKTALTDPTGQKDSLGALAGLLREIDGSSRTLPRAEGQAAEPGMAAR